jgi:hypothetical protein
MPRNINITGQETNLSALDNVNLKSNLIYKACSIDTRNVETGISTKSSKMDISIKLFGIIPVKNVTLHFVPEYKVIPGGQPIGVRIHTLGALVVGFADIDSINGRKQSPAVLSGIEIGDCIIEINGSKIEANNDISKIIDIEYIKAERKVVSNDLSGNINKTLTHLANKYFSQMNSLGEFDISALTNELYNTDINLTPIYNDTFNYFSHHSICYIIWVKFKKLPNTFYIIVDSSSFFITRSPICYIIKYLFISINLW